MINSLMSHDALSFEPFSRYSGGVLMHENVGKWLLLITPTQRKTRQLLLYSVWLNPMTRFTCNITYSSLLGTMCPLWLLATTVEKIRITCNTNAASFSNCAQGHLLSLWSFYCHLPKHNDPGHQKHPEQVTQLSCVSKQEGAAILSLTIWCYVLNSLDPLCSFFMDFLVLISLIRLLYVKVKTTESPSITKRNKLWKMSKPTTCMRHSCINPPAEIIVIRGMVWCVSLVVSHCC